MFRILLFAQELLPGVKVRLDFGPGTVPFHENNGAEDYWVLSKYYGAEKYEAEDYNDTVDEAEMPGHQILVSLLHLTFTALPLSIGIALYTFVVLFCLALSTLLRYCIPAFQSPCRHQINLLLIPPLNLQRHAIFSFPLPMPTLSAPSFPPDRPNPAWPRRDLEGGHLDGTVSKDQANDFGATCNRDGIAYIDIRIRPDGINAPPWAWPVPAFSRQPNTSINDINNRRAPSYTHGSISVDSEFPLTPYNSSTNPHAFFTNPHAFSTTPLCRPNSPRTLLSAGTTRMRPSTLIIIHLLTPLISAFILLVALMVWIFWVFSWCVSCPTITGMGGRKVGDAEDDGKRIARALVGIWDHWLEGEWMARPGEVLRAEAFRVRRLFF